MAQKIENILHPVMEGVTFSEEESKKKIIALYETCRHSTTLCDALRGKYSIVQKQQEIIKNYHNPLPLFRPTFNREQNKEVNELEELLGSLNHLRSTKGFCLNNVSDATLGTIGATCLGAIATYAHQPSLLQNGQLGPVLAGLLVLPSIILGITFPLCYNNESHRLWEAQLIDETIKNYDIAALFREKGYL